MMAEPPAKRPKMALSAREPSSLPGSRMLHQTVLVMLFLVRLGRRSTDVVTASFSQIGSMVQTYVDRAFHKYHEMISSKLESFQGQIEGLHREVRQLARVCSIRYADEQTRKGPNHEDAAAEGSNINTRLCFLNALRPPVYTNKNIRADDNAGIKVAMLEGNATVTDGLLSRVKIELLVLRGDFSNNYRGNWTEEEFDKHIVQGRDGKDLVLGAAWLTNGEVELNQIRFTEGSCRTPSRKFIVAARVCKGEQTAIRVREAIMEPVTILDRRNEPNKKSHPPRLYDEVYRLEKISNGGDYHKRLQKAKIYTVEDFLKALNMDPDNLCEVLQMRRQRNSWSKLTQHAREYILEDRKELKPYVSKDGNVMVLFNCVYDLVGAMFYGDYVASENFDSHQKVLTNKLKEEAYNILENIPSRYVMKGNIPELICAAEDLPHDEISDVALPSYPTISATALVDPITPYYDGTITPLLGQQQTFMPSIVSQQNHQPSMEASYPFELASTQRLQQDGSSGASTSSQPNIELHHFPQVHERMAVTAPAWTTTVPQPQLWSDEHEQNHDGHMNH